MIVRKTFYKSTAFLIWAAFSFLSCNYDSKSEVTVICAPTQVSFSSSVMPILVNNCMACHSATNASGGINLQTYSGVVVPAASGRLVGAINHLPGFAPMPLFAPKLSDCDIKKIETWVSEGALNN